MTKQEINAIMKNLKDTKFFKGKDKELWKEFLRSDEFYESELAQTLNENTKSEDDILINMQMIDNVSVSGKYLVGKYILSWDSMPKGGESSLELYENVFWFKDDSYGKTYFFISKKNKGGNDE